MRPHVSILIPAYNQPENLRYALQSIEMQTYTDYNIIITDDTRTDVNYDVEKMRFCDDCKYKQDRNPACFWDFDTSLYAEILRNIVGCPKKKRFGE